LLGVGVGVPLAVGTGVFVAVGSGVSLGSAVAVNGGVGVGVDVGVFVAVRVGVLVSVGTGVYVAVGIGVSLGRGVAVNVGVEVEVDVGVGDLVGVNVFVLVAVGVPVEAAVGVLVRVKVNVGVGGGVGVGVIVGVKVCVAVCVGVGAMVRTSKGPANCWAETMVLAPRRILLATSCPLMTPANPTDRVACGAIMRAAMFARCLMPTREPATFITKSSGRVPVTMGPTTTKAPKDARSLMLTTVGAVHNRRAYEPSLRVRKLYVPPRSTQVAPTPSLPSR
jgi:hypothetical protein